jgi:hypothetical protein
MVDTNLGDADNPFNGIGVLAFQQFFLQQQLELSLGKLYPANEMMNSDYYGDDRTSFLSEMLSGDPNGPALSLNDLGMQITYHWTDWFAQSAFIDDKGQNELDFSSEYAVFDRYGFYDNGIDKAPDSQETEFRGKYGGFIGTAWNRPFGYENQRLALAFMQGTPTKQVIQQGFNTQYGAEIYWDYNPFSWLYLTPDIQLINNKNNQLETIIGFRFKMQYTW